MKIRASQNAHTGMMRIFVLVALLGGTSARKLCAAEDKPDAPVAKADVVQAQAGQGQTPNQNQGKGTQQGATTGQEGKDKHERDEVPKRILFIIPNFMTQNDQPENQGPLTPGQKFNIAWHQYADYSAHFGNLLQAGISQGLDGIPHYGQGWIPFGERFLAQEGDQMSGSMLIYGVLPTVLHHDPRYFRKGRGSSWKRIYYAATRVVVTRTDAGRPTFNASSVFGQLGQAAISLSYYPPQDRSVKGLFQGWGVNQIYNIGWNQLKEFTPDLAAFIRRHRHKKADGQNSSGTPAD